MTNDKQESADKIVGSTDGFGEKPLTAAQIRSCSSVQSMLHGLFDEYPRALRENRLDAWCKAGHSILDFLATGPTEPPNDAWHKGASGRCMDGSLVPAKPFVQSE